MIKLNDKNKLMSMILGDDDDYRQKKSKAWPGRKKGERMKMKNRH